MNSKSESNLDSKPRAGCVALGLQTIGYLSFLAFAVTWLAQYSWLIDLLCNFQVLLFWAMLLGCILFLALRKWRTLIVLGCVTAFSGWLVFSIYLPAKRSSSNSSLSVLSCNVYHENNDYDQFSKLVREVDPDIFVVLEFTPKWQIALQPFEKSYPFRITEPRVFGAGVGVYSRVELLDKRVFELIDSSIHDCPVIKTRIKLNNRSIHLFTVHTLSPRYPDFKKIRDQEIDALADLVNDFQGEKIVAGDFNATTWLPSMRRFLKYSGLKDSRQGFGIQPTWPQSMVISRIPIDHVFISEGIEVHKRTVLGNVGSDHFPILIEVSLKDP